MLPDNEASDGLYSAAWLPPTNRYRSLIEDFELGPIALSDTSEGISFQVWALTYNEWTGDFTLTPEKVGGPIVVLNVPDVTQCGLAFDQNGYPFICYVTGCTDAKYWWYDFTIPGQVTVDMAENVTSVACCVDDHRPEQLENSDIILAYMRAGDLYYRQERERFDTERLLTANTGDYKIQRIGMNRIYRLQWAYGNGNTNRLSYIEGDILSRDGLRSTEFNVGALDEIYVRGFKTAGGYQGKQPLQQLSALYFHDLPMIDGQLVAVPRGGDIIDTITRADCVAGRAFKFETARDQGLEYPANLSITYAAAEDDYIPGIQTARRRSPDVEALSTASVPSGVNHTDDDALQRADMLLKVAWTEFERRGELSLPDMGRWARLVPSAPVNVEVRPGVFKRMIITEKHWFDGVYDLKLVRDRASNYESTLTAPPKVPGEVPPPTIPGDTTWEFMDLPALVTADDGVQAYVAGHGAAGTAWHGWQLQRDVGGEWEKEAETSYGEMMGQLEAQLPSSSPYFIDTTNTVLVSLSRAPTSTTLDLMLRGKGAWLIGDELVQIQNWVAEGANWRGSVLIRGRLDTAPATHPIGTRIVFMGIPLKTELDPTLIGTTLRLRGVSYDQIGADATPGDYPFTGQSAKEWAPHRLEAAQNGNDWVFTWTPRYRLGSSAKPLPSMHFYGWVLRFTVGGQTFTRYTSGMAPEYTYTEAEQVADFGSAQSSFTTVEIRALNRLGGEGKALSEAVS